eukprot:580214-Amphidinium_carterae.1
MTLDHHVCSWPESRRVYDEETATSCSKAAQFQIFTNPSFMPTAKLLLLKAQRRIPRKDSTGKSRRVSTFWGMSCVPATSHEDAAVIGCIHLQ